MFVTEKDVFFQSLKTNTDVFMFRSFSINVSTFVELRTRNFRPYKKVQRPSKMM